MKLTVFISNYNYGSLISRSLDAVLSQSRLPDEILITDDGSTDNSVDVIKEYARKHSIIKPHFRPKNMGSVSAAREMVERAEGDYIIPLSSDDFILPDFFRLGAEMLEENPQASMCFGDFFTFDEPSQRLELWRTGWSEDPVYWDGPTYAEGVKGDLVPGHVSMINRRMLLDAGGFREDLKWHCDWFVLLALAFRHGVCYVPEPFGVRRRHGDSYSATGRRDRSQQDAILRRILDLLVSEEYRDVLPGFVDSCSMLFFRNEMHRVFMTDPSLWTPERIMLCMPVLQSRAEECRAQGQKLWDARLDPFETEYLDLIKHRLGIE
ncbi:glycosyltransferase family 2 protein [Pseudodesulfovibrio sp.]|uniref:glycosyltransferase family 2 protein n=1 Tax=unclassified Pseudodesulfovibrio TaxID=2661612 RepID=UPI003AFFEEE9